MLQVVGSLLAIPVGLGSAYSIYRANFSVETTCQSLRTNIVSMIDKSVDASTRRMLVRRDVEAFEQTCGAVDPDATAAFKALLAADKAPVPTAPWPRPAPQRAEAQPKEAVRKAEPRPQVAAKPPAEAWPTAAGEPLAAIRPRPMRSGSMRSARPWSRTTRSAPTAAAVPAPVAPAAVPRRSLHSKRRPCRHLRRYLHRRSPRPFGRRSLSRLRRRYRLRPRSPHRPCAQADRRSPGAAGRDPRIRFAD